MDKYFDDFNPKHDLPSKSNKPSPHIAADIQVVSLSELMQRPVQPRQWLVDQLLLANGLSLIAGKPKVGKTTLARHLAACIADGEDFLGRAVTKGRVLMIALEDDEGMLVEQMKKRNPLNPVDLLLGFDAPKCRPIEWLGAMIETHRPKLVIVDTLFRFVRCKDQNSYIDVLDALTPLLKVARHSGVHISLLHHLSKRTTGDAADQINGSVAIHGSMDTSLILKRDGDLRSIESQQRYGIAIEKGELDFAPETQSFDLGRSCPNGAGVAGQILAALASYAPLIEGELLGLVVGSTADKRRELRCLISDGVIVRTGKGVRSDPFLYSMP